ncbi:sensor histidine kinase [Corynebacterium jeikeium]|jgi:signal transduction histidine kinase|uniref:histidine kinase n=3 Tax=Corynebacteriaceae TaxID=1653 RepID=A0ABC8CL90_CORST|nr:MULTISPECIES: histidine kinase [Corynebacterium]MBC6763227.1 hypothetical protein [Corynebacterium sp. LK27]HDM6623608.1 hypothetical protein [Staphylococcus aureus]ATZ09306.1 hypothetical protein A9D01_11695 [Corynebacterium striatum]EGT5592898.1 hypothetical protein [Corynebacterium striatum]EGT5613752.1 hypothetical protein [Corynebacterium striatum]
MNMILRNRVNPQRFLEMVCALLFGLIAAVPEPGLLEVSFLTALGVGIGAISRGVSVGLAGLVVLIVTCVARTIWQDGHWLYLMGELPPSILRAGIPWLCMVAVRQYVSLGKRAERERDLRRRQYVANLQSQASVERLSLAQSLHDELGHSLSLVALNLSRVELDSALPENLRSIISSAREDLGKAVEQLGDSVVALRLGAKPAPGATDSIEALIKHAQNAGASIFVDPLPTSICAETSGYKVLYRFLQEAITNSMKHAPGENIFIHLVEVGEVFRARVVNATTVQEVAHRSSGVGLSALTRDLRAGGGDLKVDATRSTFSVEATIPLQVEQSVLINTEDQESTASNEMVNPGIRHAQQRVVLLTASLIVAGLLGTEVASTFQKSRALLPPEEFAGITVGSDQAEIERVLPDREVPPRRGDLPIPGCHYYAVTARTFDDSAGDIYRVCFKENVVSSVDYLRGEDR